MDPGDDQTAGERPQLRAIGLEADVVRVRRADLLRADEREASQLRAEQGRALVPQERRGSKPGAASFSKVPVNGFDE